MGGIANNASETTDRVRLHITPFNPELLDRIIAPSIRPLASDISFHTVHTFPDRGFGYIELPTMEAKKLKSKLNGSTLKGSKVRIEEAKAEKKRKVEVEEGDRDAKVRKTFRKAGEKRKEGVLPGHELEEGRHVKRGWTESAADIKTSEAKKKRSKSKRTDDTSGRRELRFKTSVPPNATPIESNHEGKTKQKKDKDGKGSKKKLVVHEFGKTKKPAVEIMENNGTEHGQLSYVDGKGWVDQTGEVVEAERPSKRPKRRKDNVEAELGSNLAESSAAVDVHTPPIEHEDTLVDEASNEHAKNVISSSSESGDEVTAEQHAETPEDEVHPLEALFKKPALSPTDSAKRRPKPILTSFSFFDPEAADDNDETTAKVGMPPQTPHTQRDMEWRSLRSAAPTPDTAAIGRKFSFPFAQQEDEEDDEPIGGVEDAEMQDVEQGEQSAAQAGAQEGGEESAFRKWFYDNRGDLNRGWKKRRREEKKRKRQTENRRLSRRVV